MTEAGKLNELDQARAETQAFAELAMSLLSLHTFIETNLEKYRVRDAEVRPDGHFPINVRRAIHDFSVSSVGRISMCEITEVAYRLLTIHGGYDPRAN